MFGAILRCKVCNQYTPDRCTCNGASEEQKRFLEEMRAIQDLSTKVHAKLSERLFLICKDTVINKAIIGDKNGQA